VGACALTFQCSESRGPLSGVGPGRGPYWAGPKLFSISEYSVSSSVSALVLFQISKKERGEWRDEGGDDVGHKG
jgi:hypothetical protein